MAGLSPGSGLNAKSLEKSIFSGLLYCLVQAKNFAGLSNGSLLLLIIILVAQTL